MDDKDRPFPILEGGTIPWWLAVEAYLVYSRRYGDRQTLERIAERGGFGRDELLDLIRDEGELTNYPPPAGTRCR